MTVREPQRKSRGLFLEAGGTLLLVLLLFCLFIVLLYAMFPAGTPLTELIRSSREDVSLVVPKVEATLSRLVKDVRLRRANSIAWGGASEGMQLYSQDAVQTFDDAQATISFGVRDRLNLGSNSLVVVTRLNARDETGPRSYRVQVEGELRGNLSAACAVQLEIAAGGHLARIKPGGARFALSPNQDDSASLSVYSGELTILDGRGVRVPARYGVTLRQGIPVGPAVPLPEAPRLLGPQPAVYRYRTLPPQVRLAWTGAPAGEYHFQLAKNQGFQSPLVDQKLSAPQFATGKLEAGNYFWRVSRIEEGREGIFSETGRLNLFQMLHAPALAVSFPPERVPVGPYTLTGQTQPGSRVFVDGVELAAQRSGVFSHQGVLKPGVNLIRVEALDPAGNASYASRVIYGRD